MSDELARIEPQELVVVGSKELTQSVEAEEVERCPRCKNPIEPNQDLVSFFRKGVNRYTISRGAVHLDCLLNG